MRLVCLNIFILRHTSVTSLCTPLNSLITGKWICFPESSLTLFPTFFTVQFKKHLLSVCSRVLKVSVLYSSWQCLTALWEVFWREHWNRLPREAIPGSVQKTHRCGTGLVGMVVFSQRLDDLGIFLNLNNFMIQAMKFKQCMGFSWFF